jgi:uncharacterized integral membrane protein
MLSRGVAGLSRARALQAAIPTRPPKTSNCTERAGNPAFRLAEFRLPASECAAPASYAPQVRFLRRPRIDTDQVADRWQPRLYARLIALGLLVAYAIGFVLENRKAVHVHFVLISAHVSLVWLILLALGVGLLGGILLAQLERRRRRRSNQSSE